LLSASPSITTQINVKPNDKVANLYLEVTLKVEGKYQVMFEASENATDCISLAFTPLTPPQIALFPSQTTAEPAPAVSRINDIASKKRFS
jgi:hypothetical protein